MVQKELICRDYQGKPTTWTEEKQHAFGKKFVAWSKTTTQRTYKGYAIEHNDVTATNLSVLPCRFPILKEYIKQAKEILAAKMINQSFEGKASPYVLKTLVPMYDKEIKEHEDGREAYTSELRQKEAEVATKTLAELAELAKEGQLSQE